ncbi:hypothetical protein RB200_39225 [Streptomyces sp. PmtG]
MEVVAPDGRWSVRMERGGDEINIFNGRPPEDLVACVAWMMEAELFEWWATKRSEPYARKQGVRIDD